MLLATSHTYASDCLQCLMFSTAEAYEGLITGLDNDMSVS